MKKFLTLLSVFAMLFVACGCEDVGRVEKETELDYIPVSGDVQLTQHHEVEKLTVVTAYDTNRYDIKKWRITDSKVISLSLFVEAMPEGTEVYVEHVHADINVKTEREATNGFIQDSMDDSFHGTQQPGWCVSEGYPYNEIFAIEGYNETFISGYSNAYYGHVSESRLTESTIRSSSAYAQQLTVVYNLAVKYPEEKNYHSVTILDEILIPLVELPKEETKK